MSEPKFEIGEEVKCIDDREHVIVFRKEYKVLDRMKVCSCGWAYDVGLTITNTGGTIEHTNCDICNVEFPGRGIRWAGEFRFASKNKAEEKAEEKSEEKSSNVITIKTKEILEKEILQLIEN